MSEIERQAEQIELLDLGDAMEETKQIQPIPLVPDSMFGWGDFH